MATERKKTKSEVLEIIKEKGYQLKFDIDVPIEFRSDIHIIRAILKYGSVDFDKLPDSAKHDKDILKLILSESSWSFRDFHDLAKDDEEIATIAVKLDGDNFRYISKRLKSDRELAKLALNHSGHNLEHIKSNELLFDKELIKLALSTHDQAYMYMPKDLRNDKELVAQVIAKKIDSLVFEMFPDEYRNNRDVILKAVNDDGYSYKYLSETFRDDKEILLLAISTSPSILEYASERLRNDIDVAKALFVNDNIYTAFCDLGENVKNNPEIVVQAIARDGRCLNEINSKFKDDEELIRNALDVEIPSQSIFNDNNKKSASCFQYISNRLKSNKEIALTASKLPNFSLEGSPEIITSDKEIIKNAVTIEYRNIQHISSNLLKDKEFLMEMYKINDSITYYLDENAKELLFSSEIVTSEHYGNKLLMSIVIADSYIKDQKRKAKFVELHTNNRKALKISDFAITEFEEDGPVGSYLSVRFVNNIVLAGEFIFYVKKNSGEETFVSHTNTKTNFGIEAQINDDFLKHKVYLINNESDILDINYKDLEKACQMLYFGKKNNLPSGICLFDDDSKYKEAQTILNQEKVYGNTVFERIGNNRLKLINSEVEEVNGAVRVFVDNYGWRWLIPNNKGSFKALEILKNTNDRDDWNWIRKNLKNLTKVQKELIIRHFESSLSLKDEVNSTIKK
tara:strand:+ start:291 stop:2339 length:2049 start_codon:yes stop_codon:yes gene_type:complete